MTKKTGFSVGVMAILAVSGAIFWNYNQKNIKAVVRQMTTTFFAGPPCSKPIFYSIGTFDDRFGISREDFLATIEKVSALWSAPVGKDLFMYAPDGALKINLVYDYRQETSDRLKRLGIQIDNTKSSYDSLKAKYAVMQKDYQDKKIELDKLVSGYEKDKKIYIADAEKYSSGEGGQKELLALEAKRNALNALSLKIGGMQDKFNIVVDNANAVAETLNSLASSLNIGVKDYNTIGGTTGHEFTEGLYRLDNSGASIDIYQFGNRDQLERVLAHELGHALGLDHVEDSTSVMYKMNKTSVLKLTAEDIGILNTRCEAK